MKWKEADEDQRPANDEREEDFEEEYSPLQTQKFDMGFRLSELFVKPVFWLVSGALILVVLIFAFISMGGSSGRQNAEFEERLDRLEKSIASLDDIGSRLSALEKDAADTKPLMARLERLETSFAKKMNEMDEKINQMARQSAAETGSQKSKPAASKSAEGDHVVQKGETLYSISKRYGITLDQLRKLNGLGKESLIQPGQKLKVK